MAEELVLAELIVDSTGVTRGIEDGNQAMRSGEVQLVRMETANKSFGRTLFNTLGVMSTFVSIGFGVVKIYGLINIANISVLPKLALTTGMFTAMGGAIGGVIAITIVGVALFAALGVAPVSAG